MSHLLPIPQCLSRHKDIAEWEGIWKSPNGHVYFLEAKHLIDFVKLREIREKLERSRLFLGLESPNVTVYLAGNLTSPGLLNPGHLGSVS